MRTTPEPSGSTTHPEFDTLRAAARLEPDAEARQRHLAEIDELERLSKKVEADITALKNNIEMNSRPKTFLGLQIGTPLEWVLVIGLSAIIFTIANVYNLTYEQAGALTGIFVLSIGAACLIATVRLKARVQAQKDALASHMSTTVESENKH